MSYTERFNWILKERGFSQSGFCEASGVARSYLRNLEKSEEAGKSVRPGADILDKFARTANVSIVWLSTGKGPREPYQATEGQGASEHTPPTPPARSHIRARQTAERDDLEEIDGWFSETLQELTGGRRYTKDQVRAAKIFLATKGNPLVQGSSPRKLVLGALEAAKEIVELGREPDPDEIFTLLIEKNAPPSGPESGAREYEAAREFTQNLLAKEIKKAEREGFRPKKGRGK